MDVVLGLAAGLSATLGAGGLLAVWGAFVLRTADRWFARREPAGRVPRGRSLSWGCLLPVAALGAGGTALLTGTVTLPRVLPPAAAGWALAAATLGAVHTAAALILWQALRDETAKPRAALVAAGAAAVWLVGLLVGLGLALAAVGQLLRFV